MHNATSQLREFFLFLTGTAFGNAVSNKMNFIFFYNILAIFPPKIKAIIIHLLFIIKKEKKTFS